MDAWARLRMRQDGIAREEQLAEAGFTRDAIRWRIRRDQWQRVLPRVYATFSGRLSRRQRIIAAGLYGGPEAQLAGVTALEVHAFRYAPREQAIHLLIQQPRRLAERPRVRVHRTDRLDPKATMYGYGLWVCSPGRAVVDALRGSGDAQLVRAVFAEAVQRGMSTIDELSAELDLARRNGTSVLREVLAEVADGVRSAPEAELRTLTRRSLILPQIRWNPRLVGPDGTPLPTPDGYIEDAGIAIEVDSREFHLSAQGWQATMNHHNRLTAAGIAVVHTTPKQIRTEPLMVLAQIESAYVTRLQAGVRPLIDVLDGRFDHAA